MSAENKIPACIGIILDGNRRWARERGLPTLEGHRRGFDNIELIVRAARDLGVGHLAVFAFSTENWNRAPDEVSYLMNLFETLVEEHFSKLASEGVAVRFVGQRGRLSEKIRDVMGRVEQSAPEAPRITLWVCFSYGGKADIAQAARRAGSRGGEITEASLAKNLWTAGMPDPDLIIRTGGEKRVSNFLLWQGAYSELFFVDAYWPAFTADDLRAVLAEYAMRERRLGK